jgi:hypothetical protein
MRYDGNCNVEIGSRFSAMAAETINACQVFVANYKRPARN